MKAVSAKEAKEHFEQLIEEASRGELIVITNGDKKVTLAPNYMFLDLEEDSPELEAELLKAVNGPHSPYSSEEMRAACEEIIRKKKQKR
jgi:PHD/YefM family antitoxin component YafN of YafNO toxin-antitoxin module